MTPITFAILFFVGGIVLLLAEIVLPSHGVLGIVGAIGLIAGVGTCFWINQYVGLLAAVLVVAALPLAASMWVKIWPHTYAGKRLILGQTAGSVAHVPVAPVQVGQLGVVVSELRPGGVCEFGANRAEARAEHGVVEAGRRVEVVAIVDGRPVVRAV